MQAGKYDRRVTIEQKTVTPHADYGTPVITWVPFAVRIAAQVQDTLPSKTESVQQGIKINAKPSRVRIRYLSGVSSDMRVVVHGLTDRVMQITGGPAELGRREGIEMVCEEYSTAGNP